MRKFKVFNKEGSFIASVQSDTLGIDQGTLSFYRFDGESRNGAGGRVKRNVGSFRSECWGYFLEVGK